MKSKIHRAVITEANLHYEGSITVDAALLEASDILPNEQVHVFDITNGQRFITYAIPGEAGSGVICVNGAGARLVQPGDLIIICTYAGFTTVEAKAYKPIVVLVDGQNRIVP